MARECSEIGQIWALVIVLAIKMHQHLFHKHLVRMCLHLIRFYMHHTNDPYIIILTAEFHRSSEKAPSIPDIRNVLTSYYIEYLRKEYHANNKHYKHL